MEIICFVILHYKDLAVTDRCVQSILKMEQQQRIRIVIVDNDWHDSEEKRKRINQRYRALESVTVIPIRENGGFSYANNIGYQYARERLNSSFIIVLNNDIEFLQRDFVSKLENVYEKKRCCVIGPDIVKNSTGEHQNPIDLRIRSREEADYTIKMNQFVLRFYSFFYPIVYWKLKLDEKKSLQIKKEKQDFYNSRQEQIVPFGACLIFTPKFIDAEEKAFWPETNFYYEEYLLAHRCLKKGYLIVYDPELVAMHESGAATQRSYISEKKRIRFMMQKTLEACKIYRKVIVDSENE